MTKEIVEMNHHLEVMEVLGAKASAVSYGGAATAVGSGAIVVFGLAISQIQIAFLSMIIGAIVGFGGLFANIVFKYLAHKELCRVNRANEAIKESIKGK
jgi:hypothetical protein